MQFHRESSSVTMAARGLGMFSFHDAMKREDGHLLTILILFCVCDGLKLLPPVFQSNMNTVTILVFNIPPHVPVCFVFPRCPDFPLVLCF